MALILVTGALGQLGREVLKCLTAARFKVKACSRQDLDIADDKMLDKLFASYRFAAVINCASYTMVDLAEKNKTQAMLANALGPYFLALQCLKQKIPLIHISTDYVFGENSGTMHDENEVPKPSCLYGQSKLKGEELVIKSGCDAVILRTSWLFGKYGNNFVKKIVNKARLLQVISVVDDEFGNPTPASALAEAILYVLKVTLQGEFRAFGVYHFAGKPAVDRITFAKEILSIARDNGCLQQVPSVRAVSACSLNLPASRPKDSSLNTSKFERVFGMHMPKWRNFIEETVKQ